MTFSDLSALVYHDEPVFDDPVVRMPYNNQYNGVNWNTSRTSSDWDLWSIGMMTLEVIVVTELVLPLHTHECVESLMTDIRAHIPGPTHQLLTEMLFHVRDEQALINSKSDFFKNIYKFEEAINGIENAKMGTSNASMFSTLSRVRRLRCKKMSKSSSRNFQNVWNDMNERLS